MRTLGCTRGNKIFIAFLRFLLFNSTSATATLSVPLALAWTY